MALLCLRATPVDNKLASPAELLLGRPVQDNLPRKIPSSVNCKEVVQRLQDKRAKQKAYNDQHATALPSLVPGQSVTIQNHKTHTWEPAVVQEKLDVPRSYVVTTPTGGNLRRNRSQIREAHSKRVKFDLDQDETTPLEIQITTKIYIDKRSYLKINLFTKEFLSRSVFSFGLV